MNSEETLSDFYSDRIKRGTNGRNMDVLGGAALMPSEAKELNSLVKLFGLRACVEVGTGLGASAVAISSALRDSTATAGLLWTLDPFQEQCGEIGLTEIRRLGLSDWVQFRPMLAEDFLQEAKVKKQLFDLILQDGAHSIGPKMTHTFLGAQVLKPGGLFVFHDAFRPCTAACVTYLVKDLQFEVISLPPESSFKRFVRCFKYGVKYGPWYGHKIAPYTHLHVVALRKPTKP